jgi:hypothetical protein
MKIKAHTITISLVFICLGNLLGDGVVIYKENGFDDNSQAKIRHYISYKPFSSHLEFTDQNGKGFELYNYNHAYIIASPDDSDSSWDATYKIIKKGENLYPQLTDELTAFEKDIIVSRSAKKLTDKTNSNTYTTNISSFSGPKINFITKKGTHYDNAVVKKFELDGIVIEYDNSIRKLQFIELSEEDQKKYGYNSQRAAEKLESLSDIIRNSVWSWQDNDEISIDQNLKIKNRAFGWTAHVREQQGNDLIIILDSLGRATGRPSEAKAVLHFSPDRRSYNGSNFGGADKTWGKLISQTHNSPNNSFISATKSRLSENIPNEGNANEGGVFIMPSKKESLACNGIIVNAYPNTKYPIVGCTNGFPIIKAAGYEVIYKVNNKYNNPDPDISAKDIKMIQPLPKSDANIKVKDNPQFEIRTEPFEWHGQIYSKNWFRTKCDIIEAPKDSYAIQFVSVNGQFCNDLTRIGSVKGDRVDLGFPSIEWTRGTEGIEYNLYFFNKGLCENMVNISQSDDSNQSTDQTISSSNESTPQAVNFSESSSSNRRIGATKQELDAIYGVGVGDPNSIWWSYKVNDSDVYINFDENRAVQIEYKNITPDMVSQVLQKCAPCKWNGPSIEQVNDAESGCHFKKYTYLSSDSRYNATYIGDIRMDEIKDSGEKGFTPQNSKNLFIAIAQAKFSEKSHSLLVNDSAWKNKSDAQEAASIRKAQQDEAAADAKKQKDAIDKY